MGFRLPMVISPTKRSIKSHAPSKSSQQHGVPKGHVAVYVGDNEDMQRYVVPLAYLNHPLFQDLLSRAEEEYGFHHPMGGLTIPCDQHLFVHLIAQLSTSSL